MGGELLVIAAFASLHPGSVYALLAGSMELLQKELICVGTNCITYAPASNLLMTCDFRIDIVVGTFTYCFTPNG